MNKKLSSLFGLKWNPFSPEIAAETLLATPKIQAFARRIENLAEVGGFALVTGEVGTGKSSALRLMLDHLSRLRDVKAGVLTRPQSNVADFYREIGQIFGVELKPHNRWSATRMLREQWINHLETSLFRAILVVDEAQEMKPAVLNELRLIAAAELDSRMLLTIVLCGDQRLPERFRTEELLPLGSRIRVRLSMEAATPDELAQHLKHVLSEAGNLKLMTPELVSTLAEHAAGNIRALMGMANELLDAAIQRDLKQLDEKLYFDVFAPPPPASPRKTATTAGSRTLGRLR